MRSKFNYIRININSMIFNIISISLLAGNLLAYENECFLSPKSFVHNKAWEISPADVKVLPSNAEPWIFTSKDDAMKADLRVCIAICAKNRISGKTMMFHITSTAHFPSLKKLPHSNKNDFQMAKKLFFKDFFNSISGKDWAIAIISSKPIMQYDYISANELKKYFLGQGLDENNIRLDTEKIHKTVFMNGEGKVFISPLISPSDTQIILPEDIINLVPLSLFNSRMVSNQFPLSAS